MAYLLPRLHTHLGNYLCPSAVFRAPHTDIFSNGATTIPSPVHTYTQHPRTRTRQSPSVGSSKHGKFSKLFQTPNIEWESPSPSLNPEASYTQAEVKRATVRMNLLSEYSEEREICTGFACKAKYTGFKRWLHMEKGRSYRIWYNLSLSNQRGLGIYIIDGSLATVHIWNCWKYPQKEREKRTAYWPNMFSVPIVLVFSVLMGLYM